MGGIYNGTGWHETQGATILSDNIWHYFAMAYSNESGLKLYLDGVQDASLGVGGQIKTESSKSLQNYRLYAYFAYIITAAILAMAWFAIKKRQVGKNPKYEEPAHGTEAAKIAAEKPAIKTPEKKKKARKMPASKDNLDDMEKRIEEIKKKLNE